MVQSNSGKGVESTKKSWKGCRKSAEILKEKVSLARKYGRNCRKNA
jgi:hypothetical protein